MNRFLTKVQKQELGKSIAAAGYAPSDFVFTESVADDDLPFATFTHRESSENLILSFRISGKYTIRATIPGTSQASQYNPMPWEDVPGVVAQWANKVRLENEAVDPWELEAENMANDDSYFSVEELPRVDRAIDESLADLQQKAVEGGKSQKQIEGQLSEIKQLLKKTARSSTKKEWLSLFKGVVVGKLVDWGMQAEIFHDILHVLITSAHDVAQLAEHAARHLP